MVGVGAYVVKSMSSLNPYVENQFLTAPSLMIIAGSLHVIIGVMGLVLTFFNHKLILLTVRGRGGGGGGGNSRVKSTHPTAMTL